MYKLLLLPIILVACVNNKIALAPDTQSTPNILWITCEDISPTLSMYGDSTAVTPNLDALAQESMIYDNAFATVGVCAPARSSIITGMYPTSIGTMHMRTGKDIIGWGKRKYKSETGIKDYNNKEISQYSVVTPNDVRCFTEYLREAGYYCTNNAKTDYQFAAPQSAWDENNNEAHWRNTPEGQPFFSVFNINLTHESKLWKHKDKPLTVSPSDVKVPPYLPEIESIQNTIARHYSNVELMDKKVGELINQLKADGLYDNTIIFFYSDHGGPLPRQKREAYDSGLKVPMMIKHIDSKIKGRENKLISFVDLAPTVLSIAGVSIPNYLNGQAFINSHVPDREYIYGSGDRFDGFTDRVRIIRTKDYLYVRNYYPNMTGYKDIGYRKNVNGMEEMFSMYEADLLDSLETIWFDEKTEEELYKVKEDHHNINNLSDHPEYAGILRAHRHLLENHISTYGDLAVMPESELIESMWKDGLQPTTETPKVIQKGDVVIASCDNKAASISYLITDDSNESKNMDAGWKLYTQPIEVNADLMLFVKASRIGYADSEIVKAPF